MLAILELPFVDLRSFVGDERGLRLNRPAWPLPLIGLEFVRNFGVVRPTPGGGLQPWSGEEYFCAASSALTFVRSPTRNPRVRLEPLHRRLMTNGTVGRVEVAFKVSSLVDIEDVFQSIAELPVRVGKSPRACLVQAGLRIASLYARSTIPVSAREQVQSVPVVIPGIPLILIERRGLRGDGLATVMDDPESGVLLEHLWQQPSEIPASLWVLSHGSSTTPEAIRAVRVHAMRLHCELQAFMSVLRACLTGQVNAGHSERLRDYLYSSSKRILRPRYEGLPQKGLLAGMSNIYTLANPDFITSVEAAFQNVSPSLARLINEAVDVGCSPSGSSRNEVQYFNIINTGGGKIIMGDNNVDKTDNIEIGAGAQVRGAVGRDIKIERSSFGDADRSDKDLEPLLRQLIQQLEELNSGSGNKVGDELELARMAEAELKSEQPAPSKIRALVSSIFGGIREAGEAAGPAIKTIEAIQQLVQ